MNGTLSEWETYKHNDYTAIMENPPESIVIHIEDFYKDSPDAEKTVEIDTDLFILFTRKFVQEHNRQVMADFRHRGSDKWAVKCTNGHISDHESAQSFINTDNNIVMANALTTLTVTQKRRWKLFFVYGYRIIEIAHMEGVYPRAIQKSLEEARRKIKKIFE